MADATPIKAEDIDGRFKGWIGKAQPIFRETSQRNMLSQT
jgi:hypothetical protein